MRMTFLHPPRYISAAFLAIGLLATIGAVAGSPRSAYGDLLFFRAIEDKEAYAKDGSRYDRVVLPPGSARAEVYVERLPALIIRLKEIRSVVAEKSQPDPNAQKLLEEVLRLRGEKAHPPKDGADDYTITFALSEQGAKKFKKFAQRHDREMFDVRFRNERVSVGRLIGPFEQGVFGAFVGEDTVTRLKMVFPQLKVK